MINGLPSIQEITRAYQSGQLSPINVAQQCFNTIEKLNKELNAVVYLDEKGALKAAEESQTRWSTGTQLSKLDGIPLLIKDNIWVKDMTVTWGSLAWRDFKPPKDDIAVKRLREAGAVILGLTNTPEFAMSFHTDNLVYGLTRNPIDTRLTPGGSSGGSAAAVASGMVPIALSTDAGGSTRLPASLTGVYGLRPTVGAIARRWGFPALALDFQIIGLMARRLEDLEALFETISGPHPDDPLSYFAPSLPSPNGSLSIKYFTNAGGISADESTTCLVVEAAEALRLARHNVKQTEAPYDLEEIRWIWRTLTSVAVTKAIQERDPNESVQLTPYAQDLFDAGIETTDEDYLRAVLARNRFRENVSSAWGDADLFICPTTPVPAWRADQMTPQEDADVTGAHNAPSVFTTWVNAIGYPSLSIPYGEDSEGRPIGVQAIARPGNEALLFEIAKTLSR